MELQSLGNGWDNLGRFYGVCWKGLGPNARVVFVLEIKMQKLLCFACFWCFGVQGCLRDDWLVFLAYKNV